MKLRSLLVAVAAMTALALLMGCGVKNQPLNPQQIAAIACPQLDLVHTQLVVLNTALEADPATAEVGSKAAAQLAAVQPIVNAVCNGATAAPAVDASSIQTLISTGLPALGYLVGSVPMPAAQAAQIQAALVVAETAAGVVGVVEQQIKASQAAPAAASTSADAPQASAKSIESILSNKRAVVAEVDRSTNTRAAIPLVYAYQRLDTRLSHILYPQTAPASASSASSAR